MSFFSHTTHHCQNESQGSILLILDVMQTVDTHRSVIERLSQHFNVDCLSPKNQSSDPTIFDWSPSIDHLERALSLQDTSYSWVIGEGIGAHLIDSLHLNVTHSIRCNPTIATMELHLLKHLVSWTCWQPQKSSRWLNRVIESTWVENLPQPIAGVRPYIDRQSVIQALFPLSLSHGTWNALLKMLCQPSQGSSQHISIFLGSEHVSANSSLHAIKTHYSKAKSLKHTYFPQRRQSLLLAESVQRDILTLCMEGR